MQIGCKPISRLVQVIVFSYTGFKVSNPYYEYNKKNYAILGCY